MTVLRIGIAAVATLVAFDPAAPKEPFAYRMQMNPIEGPQNGAVNRRYTRQWSACQERAFATRENENCFVAELARQDRLLNRTWPLTLRRFSPTMRKQLIAAQRKWNRARDPFCTERMNHYLGGTIMTTVYLDCQVELIIRRTMWLEKLGR